MIPLWVFIIACVVFIGILVYEGARYKLLSEDMELTSMLLGYYSMRFGQVSAYDYEHMVGTQYEFKDEE